MVTGTGDEGARGLFGGTGRCCALCRAVDWGATALGDVAGWSPALRTAVRICFDSAATMAVWAGPDFNLICNDGYLPVLGSKAPEAIGKPARDVWAEIWDQLGGELRRGREQCVASRHVRSRFMLVRNGSHEEAFFDYSLTPVRDDHGRVVALLNILEETTGTVREQARRDSLLSAIVESSPDLIAAVDTEFRYIALNQAYADECARIFGVAPKVGTSVVDALAGVPADQHSALALFRRALGGEKVVATETFGDPERSRRVYDLRVGPIRDADQRIIGAAQIGRDVTDRKAIEEGLRETDRRRSHFLAVLSHELRNPLAPIKNSLYILERAVPGGEQARRAKAVIDRQVAQLAHLVDDLLDVTRISRNKVQLQRERVELNELVRRSVDDHRSLFEQSGIKLHLDLAPVDVIVDADRNRMAQVVGNLLTNAAKFTGSGGHVHVALAKDEVQAQAVLRVADTGSGIAPEVIEHLFEPFVQADATLDRSKGGLGLGLALVKGLVALHGGEVHAHSAGVGHGTELLVRLPLAAERDLRIVAATGRAGHRKQRVLIIEDSVDAATSLRELLEMYGHQVTTATDGPQGMARARELDPDVVLCDIGLPGMSGYDVARSFRADERLRRIHLVALSGYAQPEDLQRSAEAGFEHHLSKPVTIQKLDQILDGLRGN